MNVVDLMPSTSLRRDLAFLTTLEPEVLKSFCVVALENLAGIRTFESKLESVAEKFGLKPEVLKKAIESLAYLFPSMTKEKLKESSRKLFLQDLNFSEDACALLDEHFNIYKDKFEKEDDSSKRTRAEPHFNSLEWRLDVHLDSRASTMHKPLARYLLKLSVEKNGSVKDLLLESSYGRLCEITKELEAALNEAKSFRTRRIMKLMQP
jgi:hypothetical protein